MAEKRPNGELAEAVTELEAALEGFERATATAAKIQLGSQRNLEKAAQAVTEAAARQPEISAGVQRLLAALNGARDRNALTAQRLQEVGERVRAKSEACAGLLTRFAELGARAHTTSEAARELGTPEAAALSDAQKVERLSTVERGMAALIEDAGSLARDARTAEVDDVAQQADALRQQLQAARNKVTLVFRKLAGGSA